MNTSLPMAAGMVRAMRSMMTETRYGSRLRSTMRTRGGADAAGSYVVITVADDEDLVADEACHFDPARDGHAQDHGSDAGEAT